MLPEIKTILYATGLGPRAPYVFRYALALARQHGAKIVAVHAIEPLSEFGQSLVSQYMSKAESDALHVQARESFTANLHDRLGKLCAKECEGKPECSNAVSEIRIIEGQAAQVIIDTAKECVADHIVMGAQRHTLVGEVMLGSTTRKVLHNAQAPVFVVKAPKDFAETL